MNTCVFSGNVASKVEVSYTEGGTTVANFLFAVKSGRGDFVRKNYLRMDMLKRDNLIPYLSKGKPLVITCEAVDHRWQTRKGEERRQVRFFVKEIEFVPPDYSGRTEQEKTPEQLEKSRKNKEEYRKQVEEKERLRQLEKTKEKET